MTDSIDHLFHEAQLPSFIFFLVDLTLVYDGWGCLNRFESRLSLRTLEGKVWLQFNANGHHPMRYSTS